MATTMSGTVSDEEPKIYRVSPASELLSVGWLLAGLAICIIAYYCNLSFVLFPVVLLMLASAIERVRAKRIYYELFSNRIVVVEGESRYTFQFDQSFLYQEASVIWCIGDEEKNHPISTMIQDYDGLAQALELEVTKTSAHAYFSRHYASIVDRGDSAHFARFWNMQYFVSAWLVASCIVATAVASTLHQGSPESYPSVIYWLIGLYIALTGLYALFRYLNRCTVEISKDSIRVKTAFRNRSLHFGPNTKVEWLYGIGSRRVHVSTEENHVSFPASIIHLSYALDLIDQETPHADREYTVQEPYLVKLRSLSWILLVIFTPIFGLFAPFFLFIEQEKTIGTVFFAIFILGSIWAYVVRPRRFYFYHDHIQRGRGPWRRTFDTSELLYVEPSHAHSPESILLHFRDGSVIRIRPRLLVNRDFHEVYRILKQLYPQAWSEDSRVVT